MKTVSATWQAAAKEPQRSASEAQFRELFASPPPIALLPLQAPSTRTHRATEAVTEVASGLRGDTARTRPGGGVPGTAGHTPASGILPSPASDARILSAMLKTSVP